MIKKMIMEGKGAGKSKAEQQEPARKGGQDHGRQNSQPNDIETRSLSQRIFENKHINAGTQIAMEQE